jgi:hypothetical protein
VARESRWARTPAQGLGEDLHQLRA